MMSRPPKPSQRLQMMMGPRWLAPLLLPRARAAARRRAARAATKLFAPGRSGGRAPLRRLSLRTWILRLALLPRAWVPLSCPPWRRWPPPPLPSSTCFRRRPFRRSPLSSRRFCRPCPPRTRRRGSGLLCSPAASSCSRNVAVAPSPRRSVVASPSGRRGATWSCGRCAVPSPALPPLQLRHHRPSTHQSTSPMASVILLRRRLRSPRSVAVFAGREWVRFHVPSPPLARRSRPRRRRRPLTDLLPCTPLLRRSPSPHCRRRQPPLLRSPPMRFGALCTPSPASLRLASRSSPRASYSRARSCPGHGLRRRFAAPSTCSSAVSSLRLSAPSSSVPVSSLSRNRLGASAPSRAGMSSDAWLERSSSLALARCFVLRCCRPARLASQCRPGLMSLPFLLASGSLLPPLGTRG